MSFRQYRTISEKEFLLFAVDTASGGGDRTACQVISKTRVDVPIVFHSNVTTSDFIPDLCRVAEKVYDVTGIKPVVSLERNNGGAFLMDRVVGLNLAGKYEPFVMPTFGTSAETEGKQYGYPMNTATRPKCLSDLKDAIEKNVLTIYDKETIGELLSFVVVQKSAGWKAQAESGAHDDCFVAGTMVLTDKGNVPIEKIKKGDMVMTRNGYRPVVMTRSTIKKVITNIGLTGTPNHPVITKKGEVRLDSVKASDIIYIWNEKLSSIEEKSITDIQNRNERTIDFIIGDTINGKNLPLRFIDKFTLIILEKSKKVLLSTIKMAINWIIGSKTLNFLADLNIANITYWNPDEENYQERQGKRNQKELKNVFLSGEKITLKRQGGYTAKMGRIRKIVLLFLCKIGERIILKKQKNLRLRTGKKAEDQSFLLNGRLKIRKSGKWHIQTIGNTLFLNQKKKNVNFAVKNSHTDPLEEQSIVHRFAEQNLEEGYDRVYNLQVFDTPEYFANGVLVHNCVMALGQAWQLYQLCERPNDNATDYSQYENYKQPARHDSRGFVI